MAGGACFRVEAPSTVVELCGRALRPYIREGNNTGSSVTHLRILPDKGGWSLYRNGQQQAHRPDAKRLVTPLLDCVVFEVLRSLPGQSLVVHGASLYWQGTLVVLFGPSGRGKSTAALNLLSAPIQLLSDELAILQIGSARAVPVPRPLNCPLPEDVKGADRLTLPHSKGGSFQVTLPPPAQVPRECVDVTEVHFLRLKRPAKPPGLFSLSRFEGLKHVARHTIRPKNPSQQVALIAQALRQSARTHELRYKDVPEVREEVLSLF